jgi:hypothetical protein
MDFSSLFGLIIQVDIRSHEPRRRYHPTGPPGSAPGASNLGGTSILIAFDCHTAATSFVRMIARRFTDGGWDMANDVIDLDQMQANYRAAVEDWIAAIKQEEALASVNHSVAEVDKWEAAHFAEDAIRTKVKAAKKEYEDALREKFFGF